MKMKFRKRRICPVCGKFIFDGVDNYEVCTICGWEDDGLQFTYPDYAGGANVDSLNEYRRKWNAKEIPPFPQYDENGRKFSEEEERKHVEELLQNADCFEDYYEGKDNLQAIYGAVEEFAEAVLERFHEQKGEQRDLFDEGRHLAYYEVLDMLNTRLHIWKAELEYVDLSEFDEAAE